MAMDRLIEGFLKDCKIRGLSPNSLPHYVYVLRRYSNFLDRQKCPTTEAGKEKMRDYIETLRNEAISTKTIKNHLSILSSFYEYLVYEEIVTSNPVLPVRKRYLKSYKDNGSVHERLLISVEDMANLINSTLDIRNKAIITVLAKTGIRRNELASLDVSNVNFVEYKIRLKTTAKRSNRTVFFDDETAVVLRRWLKVRESMNHKGVPALFLTVEGNRLDRCGIYNLIVKAAEQAGIYDPTSSNGTENHFSPHCCRHWFTTHLRRAGMRREFIQELRGDSRKEAIDIYDHIDLKELKEAYLAAIPQLGI